MYGAIALIAFGNVLLWSTLTFEHALANKIAPGTTFQGVSLSGLPLDEAKEIVATHGDDRLNQQIKLTGSKSFTPTLRDLGLSINTDVIDTALAITTQPRYIVSQFLSRAWKQNATELQVYYRLDEAKLASYIESLKPDIEQDAKDIQLAYENGSLVTHPAQEGITLDSTKLLDQIKTSAQRGTLGTSITLPTTTSQPALTNDNQIASSRAKIQTLVAKPLILQAETATLEVKPETVFSLLELSTANNELTYAINEKKVTTLASDLAKKVDVSAIDKRISDKDNAVIQEGRDGKKLNVSAVAKQISATLSEGKAGTLAFNPDTVTRRTITEYAEYQLGRTEGKYIEISLKAQRLYIIEGNNLVKTFTVSTGKWSTPTPIGEFQIHNHISTAWSSRYGLYMDDWMAITGNGEYGIHRLPRWPSGALEGTSHLGTPVSHGCIRLGPGDSTEVYNWASNGTKVFIH